MIRLINIILLATIGLTSCNHSKRQNISIEYENEVVAVCYGGEERILNGKLVFQGKAIRDSSYIKSSIVDDVLLLSIQSDSKMMIDEDQFAGIFFENINGLENGIALWRYGPWFTWTEPIRLESTQNMPDWDVQFYYWKHNDGTYGAAVPMSGNGYRSTIGNNEGSWGNKSLAYVNQQAGEIPCIAIAFGKNPYELFSRVYKVALESMGKGENLQTKKTLPEPFNYVGWCSWNSSANGENLNEELLVSAAKSFHDNKFPLGWMLIDDGWLQNRELRLTSFEPQKKKFPNGFKPVVDKLKEEYDIKHVGIWHTFNGYWNGIDPQSELGKRYKPEMFSWIQKEWQGIEDSPLRKCYFIKPESDSLFTFYDRWHKYFKTQGIDFVKVDNQLVTERMTVGNYPISQLAEAMHGALNKSVKNNFDNAIINCMDMTAQAYLNFGETAVARGEEDYRPYKPEETYNLQLGNAAAHIVQALYNSIYFSQMVFPDLDMFQSHNPNAEFHAIARAINNGPIYITDNIGEQKFDVLNPLVYSDGKIIRSETSLLPTEDCLFIVQDKVPFKAFSKIGKKGLLAVWNAADTDTVKGVIKAADVDGIKGEDYLLYEYFSGESFLVEANMKVDIELPRMGYKLFYVLPVTNGYASIGLSNKYNAPATILSEEQSENYAKVKLYEGGRFKAFINRKPKQIKVDGEIVSEFNYNKLILDFELLQTNKKEYPEVEIFW